MEQKQVQQSGQVSQEELAKTQVLNLNDVKELARFERKTSKKPAFLFAFAGILSISLGFAYPNIMTALDKAPEPEFKEERPIDENLLNKVEENKQVCKFVAAANADGTTGTATYTLYYDKDDKLENYTLVLTIDPLPGNAQGVVATEGVYNSYKVLDALPVTGYTSTTSYTATGMKWVADVDLTKLDKQTLTPTHNGLYFAQVQFNAGDDKAQAAPLLTPQGYICE